MLSNHPNTAYTDAPELSRNVLLGSFQLIFWIFFKPSAWRNYVKRIVPHLKPDFRLTELSWAEWRNPEWQGIIVRGYMILPVLCLFPIWLFLRLTDIQEPSIEFVLAGSLGFGLSCSLALGLVSNTAAGIASNIFFVTAGGVVFTQQLNYVSVAVLCLVFGITGSFIISLAGKNCSLINSVQKIIVSVLFGLIGPVLLINVPLLVFEAAGIPAAIASLALLNIISISLASWRVMYLINRSIKQWVYFLTGGAVIILYTGIAFHQGGMVGGLAKGIVYGGMIGACFAVPNIITNYIFNDRIVGAVSGILVASIVWGILGGLLAMDEGTTSLQPVFSFLGTGLVAVSLGMILVWQRAFLFYPFLLAWHALICHIDKKHAGKVNLLCWHAAFWNEYQCIKSGSLDEHILLVMKHDPVDARNALEYLKNKHQYAFTRKVEIELNDQILAAFEDINTIRKAHNNLITIAEAGSIWRPCFEQISHDVDNALNPQLGTYSPIVSLNNIADRLKNLRRELGREQNPHPSHLIFIAETWHQTISSHRSKLFDEAKQDIESPYDFASPVSAKQGIFVGRDDLVKDLQDLLFEHDASVFLHGPYRIGKTSLLKNLTGLLRDPDNTVGLFVDLQGAVAIGGNVRGFLSSIAQQMQNSAKRQYDLSIPSLSQEALSNPYSDFNKWLDDVQSALEPRTLLLLADEFAKLDQVLQKESPDFNEDILDIFRYWIQHRPHFQMVIASQSLEELHRWPSLVNNLVPRHIGYLAEKEARHLIEHPREDFILQYKEEAVRHIVELTRCHPALIQLLCREIIKYKNKQDSEMRFLVSLQDVDNILPDALKRGISIFATFDQRISDAGRALLCYMAVQGNGAVIPRENLAPHCPDELQNTLSLLQRLELIENVQGGYRFQIELFRLYWLAKQATQALGKK